MNISYDPVSYFRVSRKEVRQYLTPFIFAPESMHLVYKSTAFLLVAKSLTIASPYLLKVVVDLMAAPGTMNYNMVVASIVAVGATRFVSSIF